MFWIIVIYLGLSDVEEFVFLLDKLVTGLFNRKEFILDRLPSFLLYLIEQ
jgi:hypothetical protein